MIIGVSMENNLKPSLGFEEELNKSVEFVTNQFKKDPMLTAVLLYKLVEERENSNRLMKTLIQKVENIEERLGRMDNNSPQISPQKEISILSEVDEKIIELISKMNFATAAQIAKTLGYKGANAASARLNKLYGLGLLKKKRAGKKVVYFKAS